MQAGEKRSKDVVILPMHEEAIHPKDRYKANSERKKTPYEEKQSQRNFPLSSFAKEDSIPTITPNLLL
jgi:hypothetical protein